MVRYVYSWAPFVIVATVVFLSLPWLGLIAVAVFGLVALASVAALAWALVAAPVALGRAIGRRWRGHAGVNRSRAALSSAERGSAFLSIGERSSGGMR